MSIGRVGTSTWALPLPAPSLSTSWRDEFLQQWPSSHVGSWHNICPWNMGVLSHTASFHVQQCLSAAEVCLPNKGKMMLLATAIQWRRWGSMGLPVLFPSCNVIMCSEHPRYVESQTALGKFLRYWIYECWESPEWECWHFACLWAHTHTLSHRNHIGLPTFTGECQHSFNFRSFACELCCITKPVLFPPRQKQKESEREEIREYGCNENAAAPGGKKRKLSLYCHFKA